MPFLHKDRQGGVKGVWKEMLEVKHKKLARSVGVSNFNFTYLNEIMEDGLEPPAVNQVEVPSYDTYCLETDLS